MIRSTIFPASVRRNRVLIGGVVALAVVTALLSALVVGRGPATADQPTATPSPIATPVATPEPSDEPTPAPSDEPSDAPAPSQPPVQQPVVTPTPPPAQPAGPAPVIAAPDGVLPPGSIVRVVVEGLRLREGPGLVGGSDPVVLERGQLLVVGYSVTSPGFGPVAADGYTWVPVTLLTVDSLPVPGGGLLERGGYGWVASGSDTAGYLELVPPRCVEGDPNLQTIISLTEWERLACFGDRSITLEGVVGCGGCGGFIAGIFEPAWLANPMNYEFLSVDPSVSIGPFNLHYPMGIERIPSASVVRVTGHFDDVAAAECVVAPGDPEPQPMADVLAELYCSEQFVVDGYEILGVDEDFPNS